MRGQEVENPTSGWAESRRVGWLILGVVGLAALVVRAFYAFGSPPALFYGDDNTWYLGAAQSLATDHWGQIIGLSGSRVWSFRFPPSYPVVLAIGRRLLFWVQPSDAYRWVSILGGVVAAVAIARLGWRWTAAAPVRCRYLVSAFAGLVFALSPISAGASAALMSESLFMPVVAGVLLVVDHMLERGEVQLLWIAVLAALLVVGSLTRVEGLVYLAAPVLMGAFVARRRSRRVTAWAWVLAVGVLAVVAWSSFASTQAGRPVLVATNGSPVLGASCNEAEYGEAAGYWLGSCLGVSPGRLSTTAKRALATPVANHFELAPSAGPEIEAEVSRAQLDEGLDRIASDPLGALHAVPFRVARALGVYWSPTQTNHETFEGRDRDWEAVGRWFHILAVLPFATLSLVGLATRRSRIGRRFRSIADPVRLAPGLALLAVWMIGIAVTYGSARLRAPVEPVLALLAALGAGILVVPGSNAAPETWTET